MRTRRGAGFLNSVINKLPVELHIPGYQYCGPGTKLQKRLLRGDPGKNPLDRACKEHDIAYTRSPGLAERHVADKELISAAIGRLKAKDASIGERIAALGVAGAIKTKVAMGAGLKGTTRKAPKKKAPKKRVARKGGKKTMRRIGTPKKVGGFLPLILAGLGALGTLAGGAAGIAKTVIDAKNAGKRLLEAERHNKAVELSIAKGRGLQLYPYEGARYVNPRIKKNFR